MSVSLHKDLQLQPQCNQTSSLVIGFMLLVLKKYLINHLHVSDDDDGGGTDGRA